MVDLTLMMDHTHINMMPHDEIAVLQLFLLCRGLLVHTKYIKSTLLRLQSQAFRKCKMTIKVACATPVDTGRSIVNGSGFQEQKGGAHEYRKGMLPWRNGLNTETEFLCCVKKPMPTKLTFGR